MSAATPAYQAPLVSSTTDKGIAWLTISNPPVNALSRDLRAALIAGITRHAAAPEIQAIVLIGAHGTFIAGADLNEFGKPLSSPTLPEVIEAIETCAKPVIAAIEGAALGGGYEIALACDGRIGIEAAEFGLPEGTFGIIPGAGGTVRLPRATDAVTALEIVTSCRRVKAPEALELGLIDMITPDLRGGTERFVRTLAGSKKRLRDLPVKSFDSEKLEEVARNALRRGRNRPFVEEQVSAIRAAVSLPFDAALQSARDVFTRLRDSDESAALRHLFFAERQAAKIPGLADVTALPVQSVGIVGAGTMGCGIAAAFLAAGYPVTLTDLKHEALAAAPERIKGFLARAKNPAALTIGESIQDLAGCDLLLEAAFEDMQVKTALLAQLDRIAKPQAILASNTSYLDLDEIAAATGRPESVVGLHFFAPAHIMKLLEIVRGAKTSAPVLKTAFALARRLRKIAVVSGVCEGFIGNRIYNAYRAQAEAMLIDGALPAEIDQAIEALGFAMGPFSVSDMSGLDIAWANRKRKHDAGADKAKDVPVLEWLATGGRLGRKTGTGWYSYADGAQTTDPAVRALIERARADIGVTPRSLTSVEIQNRALAAIVNEALLVLEDGIAQRASDIDLVLINGYGFPRHLGGPLFWVTRQPTGLIERHLSEVAGTGRLGKLSYAT